MAEIKPTTKKPVIDSLEARRLNQPCLRTIDLRPQRGKRCRAYPHGGRTHWLDAAAEAAFEQALAEFQGRYTIGVYERAVESDPDAAPVSGSSSRELTMLTDDAIRRIPFGYRPHRHESRLNFVSAVTLEIDSGTRLGEKLPGKTADLSLLGVRIQISAEHDIPAQTKLLLHYDELQQRAGEALGSIAYLVIGSDREGDKKLLRLKRLMRATEHAFDSFVPGFIEQQLTRYKMELKDALPATYARLYERLYSQHLHFAESFYALDGEQPELLLVTTAAEWQRQHALTELPALAARLAANIHSADWLKHTEPRAVTGLHYWLRHDRGDYLLPLAAINTARRPDWQRLAEHAVLMFGCGQVQPALDAASISQALEMLPDELAPVVLQWQQRLQRLRYSLALVPLAPLPPPCRQPVPDWLREFALVPDRLEARPEPAPLTATGVRGARSQERFRYSTPTLLLTETGDELAGESVDFSINGLALDLQVDATLQPRDIVRVSFPVLQQKVKDPSELTDQSYRVVRQLGRHLTLERDYRVVGHRAARFFAHIIQQNRGRLPTCHAERRETAEALLSEQLVVRSMLGCPLFLARDSDKRPTLLAIGHRDGAGLPAPFAGEHGPLLLSALADLPVMYDLLSGYCDAVGHVEKPVYRQLLLTTAANGGPRWQVQPLPTSGTSPVPELATGTRLFVLVLTPVPALPPREISDALQPILGHSKHRAMAFRTELSQLVGVGSLFEITTPVQAALAARG